MATLLAYPIGSDGTDVRFRVIRRNRAGTRMALPVPLCAALARRAGGEVWAAGEGALEANAQGLRGLRRWFVGAQGDRAAFYGGDGEPYETVCDAVRTVLGFVPGGVRCPGRS
jgi:hypothetical protein